MRRNLAKPGEAGVTEGGAWVDAASDSAGDKRSLLLRQQPQHTLFCCHEPIKSCCLAVKVVSDGMLQPVARKCYPHLTELVSSEVSDRRSVAEHVEPPLCCGMSQEIGQEPRRISLSGAYSVKSMLNDTVRWRFLAKNCRTTDFPPSQTSKSPGVRESSAMSLAFAHMIGSSSSRIPLH